MNHIIFVFSYMFILSLKSFLNSNNFTNIQTFSSEEYGILQVDYKLVNV